MKVRSEMNWATDCRMQHKLDLVEIVNQVHSRNAKITINNFKKYLLYFHTNNIQFLTCNATLGGPVLFNNESIVCKAVVGSGVGKAAAFVVTTMIFCCCCCCKSLCFCCCCWINLCFCCCCCCCNSNCCCCCVEKLIYYINSKL